MLSVEGLGIQDQPDIGHAADSDAAELDRRVRAQAPHGAVEMGHVGNLLGEGGLGDLPSAGEQPE